MPRRTLIKCSTLVLVLFVSACRETRIDRVATSGAWQARRIAVVEMAIGGLEGPEETTFAFIGEMLPDSSGGLYVFSGPPTALRYYAADGRFIRQLGGEGEGPGEYQDQIMGLGIRRDGLLILRDQGNGRFNLYNADGSHADTWIAPTNLGIDRALTVDTADHVYLKILAGRRPRGNDAWPIGLLHFDADGTIVDTIPPPQIDGDPNENAAGRFRPEKYWAFSRYRRMIVGVSDSYRFEIRNADGSVVRVEKAWTPIKLAAEEKSEWQAYQDWRQPRMPLEMKPIPDQKPAYKAIFAGVDGTIWLELFAPAVKSEVSVTQGQGDRPPLSWVEPTLFDVYEADGSYLGEVGVPPRTSIRAFSRTQLWGVRLGDFDEQYAVRLTIEELDGSQTIAVPTRVTQVDPVEVLKADRGTGHSGGSRDRVGDGTADHHFG